MYYPKSQIKTNLYTNGDEYVIELTQTPYTGYYYLTSTGKAFTGKTPDDRPNQELIKVEPVIKDEGDLSTTLIPSTSAIFSNHNPGAIDVITSLDYNSALDYAQLKNINIFNPQVQLLPYYNPQQPTQQDYQNTEFRRFFCKKTNEVLYIEINKDQYDKLIAKDPQILWQLYLPFNITWQLTGDEQQVARVNKNMVELAIKNLKLPKFNLYIKEDYTKYYQ
jgi:hypothetical protein